MARFSFSTQSRGKNNNSSSGDKDNKANFPELEEERNDESCIFSDVFILFSLEFFIKNTTKQSHSYQQTHDGKLFYHTFHSWLKSKPLKEVFLFVCDINPQTIKCEMKAALPK